VFFVGSGRRVRREGLEEASGLEELDVLEQNNLPLKIIYDRERLAITGFYCQTPLSSSLRF